MRTQVGPTRHVNFHRLRVGSWVLVRKNWCTMQMPQCHGPRWPDVCPLAIAMEMKSIAALAVRINRVHAVQVAFQSLLNRCVQMPTPTRLMTPRVPLLQTRDRSMDLWWSSVPVNYLFRKLAKSFSWCLNRLSPWKCRKIAPRRINLDSHCYLYCIHVVWNVMYLRITNNRVRVVIRAIPRVCCSARAFEIGILPTRIKIARQVFPRSLFHFCLTN